MGVHQGATASWTVVSALQDLTVLSRPGRGIRCRQATSRSAAQPVLQASAAAASQGASAPNSPGNRILGSVPIGGQTGKLSIHQAYINFTGSREVAGAAMVAAGGQCSGHWRGEQPREGLEKEAHSGQGAIRTAPAAPRQPVAQPVPGGQGGQQPSPRSPGRLSCGMVRLVRSDAIAWRRFRQYPADSSATRWERSGRTSPQPLRLEPSASRSRQTGTAPSSDDQATGVHRSDGAAGTAQGGRV